MLFLKQILLINGVNILTIKILMEALSYIFKIKLRIDVNTPINMLYTIIPFLLYGVE